MARIIRSNRTLVFLVTLSCFLAAVSVDLQSATRRRPASRAELPPIDTFRSLMITDTAALDGFSFQRVMEALVSRSDTGTTSLELYQQMFDTQNRRPGFTGSGIHCDDETTAGQPSRNGFPIHCPSPEAGLAKTDPFVPQSRDGYLPIAIVNRFDLAPSSGENCGQYRLVFAKRSGMSSSNERVHIIFESVLPNPLPQLGFNGCRAAAQFWADLSGIDSASERSARMQMFFFDGYAGYPPVIHPSHLGERGGSIRTSQSMNGGEFSGRNPRFYQFALDRECDGDVCRLIAVPQPLEDMPYGKFFNSANDSPEATEFRQFFLTQVASLAIRDVNLYSMDVPEVYCVTESDGEEEPVFIYDGQFNQGLSTPAGQEFAIAIQQILDERESGVRPVEIMARADTLTCAGCHQIDGDVGEQVIFPRSLGFEHITESPQHMEIGEDGERSRFGISPAVRDVFLPHRARVLRDFLLTGKPPAPSR